MTGIISVGFTPGPFVDDVPSVPTYPQPPARDDLAELVRLARAGIDRYGDVVVIYPDWAAEPTLQRLQTVRAALDTTRLVGHCSHAPPLAGGVLVTLAAALTKHLPSAGVLLAVLPLLERQLVTVTWLARVSGLEDPAPSLWQHLWSYWPSSAFVVTSWPEPAIRRLHRDDRAVALPRPRRTVGLAVADHDGDPAWVRAEVMPGLGSVRLTEVDASAHTPAWWGSRRVTEAVLHPIDLPAIAARLSGVLRQGQCAWCRHDVADLTCPFCGLPSTGPVGLGLRVARPAAAVHAGALVGDDGPEPPGPPGSEAPAAATGGLPDGSAGRPGHPTRGSAPAGERA